MIISTINILVFVIILSTIIYKLYLSKFHTKLRKVNPISTVIIAYIVSDFIDLTCTGVFSFNSMMSTLQREPVSDWNAMHPMSAIILRLLIVGSSLVASFIAHKKFTEQREQIRTLRAQIEKEILE